MESKARQAVRLFDEGKTPPEIAAIIDAPEDAVHRLLESRRVLRANPHVDIAREVFRKLADEAHDEEESPYKYTSADIRSMRGDGGTP